jgi:drug/metabolite transporter (DMT)-like permease
MVVWAANFIVVKDVIDVMPPVAFTFLRYALAAAALVALLRWTESTISIPRRGLVRIIILGGLGFGIYQILWTVGLQTIPAGDSALIIASSPVFAAVIAVLVGTDTLSPAKALGVVISFVGVVVVIASGVGIELAGDPLGFALTLAAALCWATYTAVGARFLRDVSSLQLTTWATVGGVLVLAPVGIGQLASPEGVASVPADAWAGIVLAILYSGLLAAAAANVIIFRAVGLVGPTRVIVLQTLVPALAVVFAAILLSEPIRPGQLVGGAIILAGVALTRRASGRHAPARAARAAR